MKYIYKVNYEQKFGREWFSYVDRVIGGNDGQVVIEKVRRKSLNQALDEHDCAGFRLIGLDRAPDPIDY